MTRTLVIGDVHGCIAELESLLRECRHRRGDRVVFTGDLVAKGPDSRAVVQLARSLGARAVRGNHDEKVLRWFRAGPRGRAKMPLKPWHRQTVESLGAEEWEYLAALPAFLRLPGDDAFVVHAGVLPGRPLEEQREEDLFNMRSLTPSGGASKRIEGGTPWARAWKGPQLAVFGHDAIRGLQLLPNAIGLDSGCVYGGRLTALLLPERRLVSVPALRQYAPLGTQPRTRSR
ncbi:MAG: metallophosphoesterase [Myxococcaceae bacterium]